MEHPLLARKLFLTKGVGRHKEKLNSFELALRRAGIAQFNLSEVSSILPPGAKIVSREAGLEQLAPGQVVFTVMSKCQSCEPNRLIAASVGLARPRDRSLPGYLSEHHAYGQREKVAGDYAEDVAAEMLATTLGLEFDPEAAWDEKREIWKISGQMVESRNITQTAVGHKDGLWTTVVAAAILVF
jgi:arginine decarboxylase